MTAMMNPSMRITGVPLSITDILLGDEEPEIQGGFRVDSLEKAQWSAGKYLEAERRMTERQKLAEVYISRIQNWLMKANQEDQDSLGYFSGVLRPWLEERLRGVRGRSLSLPGLRLGLRKKPDRVEITNPLSALEYCEKHLSQAVMIKKDLSKTELKKVLGLGKNVPGAEFINGDDELSIKEE